MMCSEPLETKGITELQSYIFTILQNEGGEPTSKISGFVPLQ